MLKRAMAIAIVLSAMSVSAYAQQCLHGPNETPDISNHLGLIYSAEHLR